MILATDIGYGHTKYAFNNTLNKFPSIIAPVYGMSETGFGESNAVKFNSKNYLVGEYGKYENNIIVTNTEDFLTKYSPLLIHEIFRQEKIKKAEVLCVSLSIAEFHEKKEQMKKVCQAFMINNRLYEQNVNVYPQGLGVWADMGRPENAVIIDIGFNTVDVITFLNNKPIREYSFGLMGQGVCNITGAIGIYLNKKFNGTYLSPDFANEILLNNGKFNFMRRQYDISDFISDVKIDYAENIISTVLSNERIRNVLNKIDTYIVAGGGAYYVSKNIYKKYNLSIPEQPEYSNVRGFLKVAQENQGQ